MNTQNTQEKWRQYGVMCKDTTDTLGGMLRIETPHGLVFTETQEAASAITRACNAHEELLCACKVALVSLKGTQNPIAIKALENAITKAEGKPL